MTRRSAMTEMANHALAAHRGSIKTRNEAKARANLEAIFKATLEISNKKGFAAMTLRELSGKAGLSMGALYDYFGSKAELLAMLQSAGRAVAAHALGQALDHRAPPRESLAAALKAHLEVSEQLRPWFFFSYMEAHHLEPKEKKAARKSELVTEEMLARIIRQGIRTGDFRNVDPELTAAGLKALLQDWYLKRTKYSGRSVKIEDYTAFIRDWVETYLNP